MESNTPQLALDLIQSAKEQGLSQLNLGKTGLKYFPMEILELTNLEELCLSNRYFDETSQKWTEAPNDGTDNHLSFIPERIAELQQLKTLQIGGDYEIPWAISDIRFLIKMTNLQVLNLSSNKIWSYVFLKRLINLKFLYLRSNDINDVSFLKNLKNLKKLDLRYSKISDYTYLKNLKNLQILDLCSNQISSIHFLERLVNLQFLDFHSNKISDISFLKNLKKLKKLDFGSNQISDVVFLTKLTNLTFLDFSRNQISDITPLEGLRNLTFLDLSRNQINDITFLKELTNLKSLDFRKNQISDITSLKELTNLTFLDFSRNQISDITSLKELTNLEALDLSRNQISQINLKNFKELQTLNIQGNPVKKIFIKNFFSIRDLNLSDLQIEEIYLENVPNLQFLSLRNNEIRNVSFLENLTNLQSLDLCGNKIVDYSFLRKLTNLQSLNLKSNRISNISFLERLTKLHSLNLSDNIISNISFLKKLTSLQSLNLSSNRVHNYSFLQKLINLHSLNLSNNKVNDYSFLRKLPKLKSLNLNDNKVSDIHFLRKLTNLQSLSISNNQITDITPLLSLIELNEMQISFKKNEINQKINLHNNPISIPPPEILNQGNKAILNYLKALEQGETVELYESKMLIIGEGGVGKTSLLTKILDEAAELPKEEDTTRGIDIQSYCFQTQDNQEFRINIWDFGGQEIYHATHQFFLTKRSLYVLVDDTRKGDKNIHDVSFNYWLQTVELLGGDSPIVIVQNEKGDRSKALDLKSMQAIFNIKDLYVTNLLTCRNLAKTKTALEYYIQQLPHIGTKLPKQWLEIRNALEDLERSGTSYISLRKYFDVCGQHDIREQAKALYLSQYLHDLGVFLHFQEDDILHKTVILNNEWATDAVYKVLDCEMVKTAKGQFLRKDLQTIWGDDECREKYRNMHGELLALMKNFELCYELEGKKNTFLAPQLFAEEQPDYVWNDNDNLILRYEYGFMPKGLVSRFIVRMHRYVKYLGKAWKNGVVLERSNAKAEVVSLYAQQEIQIRVNGHDSKVFLDIIMEEFEKMHSLFDGIKVEKLMPCNCNLCKKVHWKQKHYFEFNFLKKAYQKNSPVQCQKTLEMVGIHQIVDTLTANKLAKMREEMGIKQDHLGVGDNVGRDKIEIYYNGDKIEDESLSILQKGARWIKLLFRP